MQFTKRDVLMVIFCGSLAALIVSLIPDRVRYPISTDPSQFERAFKSPVNVFEINNKSETDTLYIVVCGENANRYRTYVPPGHFYGSSIPMLIDTFYYIKIKKSK